MLGLLEVDDARRKVQALGNQGAARILIDATAATAVKFRKYMLVRTQMSVMTGSAHLGARMDHRASVCGRVGNHCVRAQLHSVYRSSHRDAVSNPARNDAVFHVAGGIRNIPWPEFDSVRRRQLHRATRVRRRVVYFALRRAVCRLLLDFHVGIVRRLHRGSDRHRNPDILQLPPGQPVHCGSFRRAGASCGSSAPRSEIPEPHKAVLRDCRTKLASMAITTARTQLELELGAIVGEPRRALSASRFRWLSRSP